MAIQFGEGLPGSDFVSIFCVWEHVYVLRLQIPVSAIVHTYVGMCVHVVVVHPHAA